MSEAEKNEQLQNSQYVKLSDKLIEDLNTSETDEEKVLVYIKFLENYMMAKEYWTDLLKISNKQHEFYCMYIYHPIFHDLVKRGPYYFRHPKSGYDSKIYESFGGFYQKVNTAAPSAIKEYLIKHEKQLMFPHKELQYFLIQLERDQFSPISKEFRESVNKLEKLFWEIKASEKDVEKWLDLLKKVNDPEFVKHNVEDRLLNDLSNMKLWKLYIQYWKERDPQKMLHVYSNYCRYFLDDEEMKELYRKEVEKHGPIFVKWKIPFEFENGVESPPMGANMTTLPEPRRQQSLPEDPPYDCPKIDFATAFVQEWSIPKPIIRFIASQTYPLPSEKLLQLCKFFLKHNKGILYCYKAVFVNKHYFQGYKITENSLLISVASLNSSPFDKKNIYIKNVLIFEEEWKPNSLALSNAIKNNIYKCDAELIDINNQILTAEEFKFLVGHGNVRSLVLHSVKIFKNDRNEMMVDEIFEMTPKLQYVSINVENLQLPFHFSEIYFSQKLLFFQISFCANIADSSDYCNFLKKYAAPCSRFSIQFEHAVDEGLYNNFQETVTNFVNEWEPADEKPVLTFIRY